jgi:hypothetical protein
VKPGQLSSQRWDSSKSPFLSKFLLSRLSDLIIQNKPLWTAKCYRLVNFVSSRSEREHSQFEEKKPIREQGFLVTLWNGL